MADWDIIQDRTISGKGVLKIPNDVRKNRAYVLYADIIRPPSQRYLNLQWNPYKGRYGNLVFLRNDYVIGTVTIDFPAQAFDGVNDISGQTLLAVKCAYEGVLQSFANLAVALSATPGSIGLYVTGVTDLIKDYENLRMAYDEVRLVCYADTAIQLRVDALRYDTCDPDNDKDKPPRKPPPPKTPVPPGTPVPNDDPYDDDTNDDGNSEPFPGDEPEPPPPFGDECVSYDVAYEFDVTFVSTGAVTTRERVARVWGEVGNVFNAVEGGNSIIKVECRGLRKLLDGSGGELLNKNDPCGDFREVKTDELSLNPETFPITAVRLGGITPT